MRNKGIDKNNVSQVSHVFCPALIIKADQISFPLTPATEADRCRVVQHDLAVDLCSFAGSNAN